MDSKMGNLRLSNLGKGYSISVSWDWMITRCRIFYQCYQTLDLTRGACG